MRSTLIFFVTLLSLSVARAAKVDTRQIPSESMGKTIPALVITPDSYAQASTRYPVVYLLHGKSGAYGHWGGAAPLRELADRYQLMIVCPDGGKDSWYFDSPINPACRYETHVAKEVVQYVDKNYRTIAEPRGRAITGQSMGGHGALLLAMRHRDVFGAAGSMSGVLDIRLFEKNPQLGPSLVQWIGSIDEFPDRWNELSVMENLRSLKDKDLSIMIECGTDDGFLKVNQAAHQLLLKDGVEHEYLENPGRHDWTYWKSAIPDQLAFFHAFFAKSKAAPTL
ncbi:MAG: alpha/beta hydrolase [Chthoniobacteraceae bacterium]